MIRPLTILPRSWRMTEVEQVTVETLARRAAHRLKVRRSFLVSEQMHGGEADYLDDVNSVIVEIDSMRAKRVT